MIGLEDFSVLAMDQNLILREEFIRGSPAPTNLVVPPHKYIDENTILIGEDSKDKA